MIVRDYNPQNPSSDASSPQILINALAGQVNLAGILPSGVLQSFCVMQTVPLESVLNLTCSVFTIVTARARRDDVLWIAIECGRLHLETAGWWRAYLPEKRRDKHLDPSDAKERELFRLYKLTAARERVDRGRLHSGDGHVISFEDLELTAEFD